MIGIKSNSVFSRGKSRWVSRGQPCRNRRLDLAKRLDFIRRKASSASDPYQVLGVSSKTNSENIQRAYRTKLREAKEQGDEELVGIIEQAHSAIMMQELNNRLQGKSAVSQDIAYADKAVYLPWRPRFYMADRKLTLISLGIQIALLLYSFFMSGMTGTQPVLASAVACASIVYFKLEKLFPSGGGLAFSPDPDDRKQGGKNLLRCALVSIMGTAAGIVFFFTLPDLVSNTAFHKPLPYWFYDYQDLILNSGVIFMNLLMSIFFR